MISSRLRLVLAIVVILYFIFIYILLKKQRLIMKYALLWVIVGVLFAVLLAFPLGLKWIATEFGVYADINFLFLALIGFLMAISISLTVIASRFNESIKRLTQMVGILELKLKEKEDGVAEDNL